MSKQISSFPWCNYCVECSEFGAFVFPEGDDATSNSGHLFVVHSSIMTFLSHSLGTLATVFVLTIKLF